MRKRSWTYTLTLAATLGAASSAFAQATVFLEDFESGYGGWTMTGQWNAESETDACGGQVAPFPSSSHAAWFGNEGSCDFNGCCLAGDMTLIESIEIPDYATSATLVFSTYEEAECTTCGWDWRFVYVSTNQGQTWEFVGEGDTLGVWYEKTIDLTPYLGEAVLLRFHFDAVDWFVNDGIGWFVDDIRVNVDGCPPPVNYCNPTVNSSGNAGEIQVLGSTSISANDMILRARLCPPGQTGIFFYGATPGETFFGDGYRCISGQSFRLLPPVLISATGRANRELDFTVPPLGSGAGQVFPGSVWHFQFWFRDPMGAGGGFNYTDGISVTFCP